MALKHINRTTSKQHRKHANLENKHPEITVNKALDLELRPEWELHYIVYDSMFYDTGSMFECSI